MTFNLQLKFLLGFTKLFSSKQNEAMTGTHTQSPVFSRITLALMEDSGWYKANYSMASPLSWGKGLGCSFVMKSCKDWIYAQGARYVTEFY